MSPRSPAPAAAAGRRFACLAGVLLGFVVLAGCSAGPAAHSLPGSVDAALRHAGGRDRLIAVAYCDLATGATLLRNEKLSFHAASTVKLPVMVALFGAAANGEIKLREPIAIRNQFTSLADGTTFELDPKDDGDPDLYAAAGQTRPVEELIARMIDKSSNLATNLLVARIGAERVTEAMRALEVYDLVILRGVEDGKALAAGLNNRATANDLMILLRAIAAGKAVSPAASARMVEILAGQESNEKIPAGLPAGVRVAHKTGDITGVHHDAAIVYPPGAAAPYVLVVLTAGFPDQPAADAAIAAISRTVWEARAAAAAAPARPRGVPIKAPAASPSAG